MFELEREAEPWTAPLELGTTALQLEIEKVLLNVEGAVIILVV